MLAKVNADGECILPSFVPVLSITRPPRVWSGDDEPIHWRAARRGVRRINQSPMDAEMKAVGSDLNVNNQTDSNVCDWLVDRVILSALSCESGDDNGQVTESMQIVTNDCDENHETLQRVAFRRRHHLSRRKLKGFHEPGRHHQERSCNIWTSNGSKECGRRMHS